MSMKSLVFLLFFFVEKFNGQLEGFNLESKCLKEFKEIKEGLPLLGQFKPSCEPDGRYSKKQCREGYCYCVNQDTGEEDRKTESSERDVSCDDINLRVHGKVILSNAVIKKESCLKMSIREEILCEWENCDIPVVAQLEVANPVLNDDGSIFYEIVLKNPRMTPHVLDVVLNNGWCKSKLDQVWIKYGDFKTGVSHILTPLPNLSDLKFDVKLEKYLDTNPECPSDIPITSCGFRPCAKLSCLDYPEAICKPNFCGGCKAEFFYKGEKVECKNKTCSQVCPLIYEPKCASNGVEYANLCLLELAQCKDNSILISKDGPCQTSCEKSGSSANGGLVGSFIPKCTNDGSFEKRQCHGSTGYCWCVDPKTGEAIEGTKTGPGQASVECEAAQASPIVCNKPCTREYVPVCGSDGQTYSNLCVLQNAQCQNPTIQYAHSGKCAECPKDMPTPTCGFKPCAKLFCADYPEAVCKPNFCGGCNAEFYYKGERVECKNKTCSQGCPLNYEPVCASNGVVYSNLCLLELAQCQDNSIMFAKMGPCQTACEKSRSSGNSELVGSFIPKCTDDGSFEKRQCHGSTGYCWCVDPKTGEAIEGTKTGPGQASVECEAAQASPIVCNKPCTREYVPVCGSDGQTYSNLCVLQNAQCQNPTIQYAHSGKCAECPKDMPTPTCGFKPCAKLFCADYPEAVCKPNFCGGCNAEFYYKGERVECKNKTCSQGCPLNYEPVCASNGVVYSNLCLLELAQCQDNSIMFAKMGPCQTACEKSRSSGNSELVGSFIPKCTDDGSFEKRQCHGSTGYCWCVDPKTGEAIEGTKTGPGQASVECEAAQASPIVCNKPCTREYVPVCGSDGQTYSNLCVLQNAQCQNPTIQYAHSGKCAECPKDMPTPTCGFKPCAKLFCADYPEAVCKPNFCGGCNAEFYYKGERVECKNRSCTQVCPSIYEPICASNGVEYSNPCFLEIAQCKDNSILISKNGPCQPGTNPSAGQILVGMPQSPSNCDKICTADDIPVCGTNHQTYRNTCELEKAQCQNPAIRYAYSGKCAGSECPKDAPSPTCGFKPCNKLTCLDYPEAVCKPNYCGTCKAEFFYNGEIVQCNNTICNKACTREYNPICGSNGVEYPNPCLFEVAQCEDNKLMIDVYGPCPNECPVDIPIVSCSYEPCAQLFCLDYPEAVCKPNFCGGCKADFFLKGKKIECKNTKCSEVCDKKYDPVCGNNGKTYSNKCLLKVAQCNDKSIVAVNAENCVSDGGKEIKKNECVQPCLPDYSPVCGSDGHTYSNLCEFNNSKCINLDLTIKHYFTCKNDLGSNRSKMLKVFGLVKLPLDSLKLKAGSCLSMTLNEELYCKELICNIPVLSSYNVTDVVVDSSGAIQYKMILSQFKEVPYVVRAVINNGWCKNGDDWIRYGDFHTEISHTINPLVNQEKIELNINVVEYKQPALTGECSQNTSNCPRDLCKTSTCPAYPSARCIFKNCSCETEFYLNDQKVNCIMEYRPTVSNDIGSLNQSPLNENPESCAFQCSDIYQPVCGSDRKTHSSTCTMLFRACTTKTKIFKIHNGPCGKCNTECPHEEVMPLCGSDGITYSNKCEMEKKICESNGQVLKVYSGPCEKPNCPDVCTADYRPQCGSDRKTYSNECELQAATCKSKGKILFFYDGECEKCNSVCTDKLDPYCGTDGRSYDNLCKLNYATCESGGKIQLSYPGNCKSPACPKDCTTFGTKVCGSDNKTYSSLCELQKEICKNTSIYLKYVGECREKCLSSSCRSVDFSLICGSDGTTYSRCQFRREQCLTSGEVRITYKDYCRKTCDGGRAPVQCLNFNSCSSVYCPNYPSAHCVVDRCNSCQAKFMLVSKDVTADCGTSCNEDCVKSYNPMCANNGVTYDNECILNVARCKSKGKIKLAYRGECRMDY